MGTWQIRKVIVGELDSPVRSAGMPYSNSASPD